MSHIKPTQPDNPVKTTTPIQDHPERNDPMKTENTETTVTEAEETVEVEEVTETASTETEATAVHADDDADTGSLDDQGESQDEEVDAYKQALISSYSPTPSRLEPITRSFLGKNLAAALLIIVSAFCIGTGIKVGVDTIYADEFGGNHCYNGKKYNGDMPHSFKNKYKNDPKYSHMDDNEVYKEYIGYSNMPDSGICTDQIAHEK